MKNLIIISSVINITSNPLDYTKVRSVYSKGERYIQTLKTIESCSKVHDYEILFIETSPLDETMENNIKNSVDYYINFSDNEEIKKIIDGPYKGKSEAVQIWNGLKLVDLNNYDNIIKISGRYWMGNNFKYENYDNEDNIFKTGPERLGTAMYKIHKNNYSKYIECLQGCMNSNTQLEANFYQYFKEDFKTYDKIGLEGFVSVDGNPIDW